MRPSFVRRAVALVAAAVVSAGLVTGCTENGGGADDDGGQGASGTFTPGVQQLDLTKPVTQGEFTVPGSDKDTVTVGVLGLESSGELQVLHLAFTPHFESKASDAKISMGDMMDYSFDPWLVDRQNQKVYSVVDDFETSASATTVNNQPMYAYAVFAAPQDDTTFEVRLNDVWQPFVNIESAESKDSGK